MVNGTTISTTLKEEKVEEKPIEKPKKVKEAKPKSKSPEEELYEDIVNLWNHLDSAVKSKSLHRAKKPLEEIKRKYRELFL